MRIDFTSAAPGQIPGNKTGTRRKLVFYNNGASTVFWGWEPATGAGGDQNQGIPIAAGVTVIIDFADTGNKPVYFVTATIGTINWSELA